MRLISTCAIETRDPPIALMVPITCKTTNVTGAFCSKGITLSRTMAPQVTTTELRRIEAGLGPSMASSSQRCIGNCAHFPVGPAISPSPSNVAASGLIVSAADQAYMSSKLVTPDHVAKATIPIRSITSPTLLVRKASLAAVTTRGWAYQKPTNK